MAETDITLQSLIHVLTRRWKWVFGFSLLVLVVVYIMTTVLLDDQYTASVKLLVSKSKVGDKPNPIDYTMLELDTYVHLATSRDSLAAAMEKFGLAEPPFEYRLEDFEQCVEVKQLRNTDLLQILVTLDDPGRAQQVADFLAERAVENNFDLLKRESEQSRQLFEGEVKEAHEHVRQTAASLSEFMAEAQTLPSEDMIQSSQEALWKMKQDLAFNETLREESYAKIKALKTIVEREPETRRLRRAISDEQDLLDVVRDREPDRDVEGLLSIQIESENVNYAYDKARAELIDASKSFAGAAAHVTTMASEIEDMESEIRLAEQELAQKKRLEEELRVAIISFEDIAKKNAETRTLIASERQDLKIIEHAIVPGKPSGPNRPLIAVSAAFFAFVASLLISLGLDACRITRAT